jgi:predicted GNAT family acetyltransferase
MTGGEVPGPQPITVVTNRPEQHRYEITADGRPAGFTEYTDYRRVRTVLHTEIDPQFEGLGLGSLLIADALADVRERGMTIVPQCPFVQAYVDHHPEVADLVDPNARRRYMGGEKD